MIVKIVVIALYALMIIGIGIAGLRRTKSFSDFFLGGGDVGPWMSAFTYATAYFSAVLFIGFAGKIGWGFGYSGLWIALGNALIGVLLVWGVMGHRIKRMSVEYDVHTMAEYFEQRFDSHFLKLFAALAIFVFFIPYSSAVFMGLSYLFRANFGIDYTMALVVMGTFTSIYIVLGGYKSMAMIDVVFGMIMLVGVTILMAFTLKAGGGLPSITEQLAAINPKLTEAIGPPGAWPLFCLVFLTSIAPLGMPQLVQKFYAIKDRRAIRIGMVASTCFALLIGGVAYFVGSTARLFLSPETTPTAFADGKPIFDALMPELLAQIVPESLSVIMLLLILSASMSTLAALVLIASSSVVKDIFAGFVKRNAADAHLTRLMRVTSALFVVVSVILAYFRPSTIVAVLGISWGAIGAVFLGPFLWGLFTEWANRVGAIAGSVLGLSTCLTMYAMGHSSPEAGTVGMMVSLVVVPLVSLVRPRRV